MRNGLKMVALLTLLGSRSTIAQSKGSAGSAAVASANHIASSSHAPDATRLIGGAPVGYREPVCTENLIRVDAVMESPKLAE